MMMPPLGIYLLKAPLLFFVFVAIRIATKVLFFSTEDGARFPSLQRISFGAQRECAKVVVLGIKTHIPIASSGKGEEVAHHGVFDEFRCQPPTDSWHTFF